MLDQARDAATQQTAAGYPLVKTIDTSFSFTREEVSVLRALAWQVAEISQRPVMAEKARLWTAHNDLQTQQPLVFIDPENGWNEMIPVHTLRCSDPLARVWEMALRKQIYWANVLKDDKVIEPFFDVPYSYTDTGWGVELKKRRTVENGSYIVEPAVEEFESVFEKLHHPEIVVDWKESELLMQMAHSVFDGILTVRRKNTWWWTLGLCWDYVDLRGMENFMCDFLLEPEWAERMLDLLCEGKLHMLDFLEENGLLAQNTGGTYTGSGGFGFTRQIAPVEGRHVVTGDMWGFCESQETAQVSPEIYRDFIFPRHKRILDRFALSCYGCCEPYDPRWEYVRQLPHLRKVSVSPWANWATVPEFLGQDYIASIKPSPTPLATAHMDEDVVRADCRRAVEQTKGGVCEFLMKDNHTLGGCPHNASRWVEIMREEIARVYG